MFERRSVNLIFLSLVLVVWVLFLFLRVGEVVLYAVFLGLVAPFLSGWQLTLLILLEPVTFFAQRHQEVIWVGFMSDPLQLLFGVSLAFILIALLMQQTPLARVAITYTETK